MRINYNSWFYQQHRYLQGSNEGYTSYNDTKWNNINERMRTLIDLQSQLNSEQPYSVVANYAGMNRLVGLLDKTDYTFQDVDESLVATYKRSLKNAMSSMLVNTHAVIATGKSTDKNIKRDPRNTNYYVIDVLFQQLHFGERDEVIRQQLQNMFARARNNYLSCSDFLSNDLVKLMGFALVCTCNGLICHDWMVALDDKGFHFKVKWVEPYDCEFVIYKLDKTVIATTTATRRSIENNPVINVSGILAGTKCIVDIYDPSINDNSAPNFGIVSENGVKISSLQFTKSTIGRGDTIEMNVIVYGIKYLYEVPNVYPSVNYYDMMREQPVYTKDGLVSTDAGRVIGRVQNISADTLCTPPIAIDRPVIDSFDTIISCVHMRERLMKHQRRFGYIKAKFVRPDPKQICREECEYMKTEFATFMRGAILTSWVSADDLMYFETLIERMEAWPDNIGNPFPEANTTGFMEMVNRICSPFERDSMKLFMKLNADDLTRNYFDEEIDLATRINRPISEQCIIAMKYNSDDGCWVFVAPNIKHFHGIGNAFYIDDGLEFGEAYKFFFLYTDTEAPGETNVEQMSFDTVFDYDKFESEVDKHLGYIRYWNVENHLRKLSKMMYMDDSTETQTQVLSEILRRKFEGEEFLDTYPSDMNYEPSNASSDNIHAGEFDERAPFAVNFLFYTVSMMYNNSDKMLVYFMSRLYKSNNRYDDEPFVEPEGYMSTIDFSIPKFVNATPDTTNALKDGTVHMYYGYPGVIGVDGETMGIPDVPGHTSNTYNITFHEEPDNKYPLIREDGSIDETYYITATSNSYDVRVQVRIAQYCMEFMQRALDAYAYINHYNTTPFARSVVIQNYKDRLVDKLNEIRAYATEHAAQYVTPSFVFDSMETVIGYVSDIIDNINAVKYPGFPKNRDWFTYTNSVASTIRTVYANVGFDDAANPRVNSLYEHLSKINDGMPLFEFIQWVEDIDLNILLVLDSMVVNNKAIKQSINLSSTYFKTVHDTIAACIQPTQEAWLELKANTTAFEDRLGTISNTIGHQFVSDNLRYWLKTNGIIDRIDFTECVLDTKPAYVCADFPELRYESSFYNWSMPAGQFMVFKPDVVEKQDGFHITGLRPISIYAMYAKKDDDDFNKLIYDYDSNVVVPVDETGHIITYTGSQIHIHIKHITVSGDDVDTVQMLPNTTNTVLDFQNIHNTHDVVDGNVVNVNYATTNYELIANTKFIPLEHDTEMILDRNTFEPKPIDRVRISNFEVNTAVLSDIADHDQSGAYVRPVFIKIQTLSSPGILGRYEIGDTICIRTLPTTASQVSIDLKYVFTAKVTAITHSESHACIEAEIDHSMTTWKNIRLRDFIYWMTTSHLVNIDCEILDDNFRNFMDEFNNSDYSFYPIPQLPVGSVTPETLPGDPLFVSEYSDYVYTRLNWFFSPNIPNRFPNDEQKTWDFVYVGAGSFIPTEGTTIRLLNHDWNTMDLANMYPILKDNNGEHAITALEKDTYKNLINASTEKVRVLTTTLEGLYIEYADATTESDRQHIQIQLEEVKLKIKAEQDLQYRLEDYINQPEVPTTWYNLYAYDNAITYINNGRASMIRLPRIRVYDALYTEDIEVMMYDWEHKVWLNPNDYTVTLNKKNLYSTAVHDNSETDVQYTITITPNDNTFSSRKVLVYFVYKKSDIYDSIQDGYDQIVHVRSKYAFVPGDLRKFNDIYSNIRIRKHYDTNESYIFSDYLVSENTYIVDRIRRSGKYPFVSDVRWSDVRIKDGNNEYTTDDFDVYYEFPYPNVNTPQVLQSVSYATSIVADIDDATDGDIVTLVCMNDTATTKSDGSISSALFLARINTTPNLTVTILDSTIGNVEGTFRCFVAKDPSYQSCGGIVRVVTTVTQNNVTLDETGKWYKVTNDIGNRIVPDRFMIIPHNTINVSDTTTLELHNNYELDTDTATSAYTYFYDTKYKVRYPMSDVLMNDHTNRLDIDTTEYDNVKKIRSNYMGICRYSLQRIPANGLIDLTGYIATPLTRSNYEFWINGRCLNNTKNLVILSPTTIQLTNLTSLRNFEVIELVHDVLDSELRRHGPVYSDLAGNVFGSYLNAMISNKAIRYQNIRYSFSTNIQTGMDRYANDITQHPNNLDIETDIMSYLETDEEPVSYNELYNIPSINGVPLRHPTIEDLGMVEIPGDEIIRKYNRVWSYEISARKDFPLTHIDLLSTSERVRLHVSTLDNQFRVYTTGVCNKYFTLYISDTVDGTPFQVIPMIQLGTSILLPYSYEGKWIRCTFPNTEPIQLK